MKSAKEWAELVGCSPPGTILGPMSMATMKALGGIRYEMAQDPAYDKYHYRCPECRREFINNISCPRCGWRLPR
jgi:hypothetical protein